MTQRITFSPLAERRQQAFARINAHFQSLAFANLHREQDWARKREIAGAVKSAGHVASTLEFAAEATSRDLSVSEFADLILSKSNPVDQRSWQRQQAIRAAEAAATLVDLAKVIDQLPQR